MTLPSPLSRTRWPIAGYVGPGGLVIEPADYFGPHWIEEVELELGSYERHHIFKIRGDDNFPPYSDGELLFVRRESGPARLHIGRDCIIRVKSGEMLLRTLTLGAKEGCFTLLSLNAPPIMDMAVGWASPVDWTAPGEISAGWAARKVC